jgi:hypothetical protein
LGSLAQVRPAGSHATAHNVSIQVW